MTEPVAAAPAGRGRALRLEQVVMDCLEKAPGKGPTTALELRQGLGEVPL
jgi:hypothetical protein